MFLDIHSHILPDIDDGASNKEEALELLEMMYAQGITDVIATPHFYPQENNFDIFIEKVSKSFNIIKKHAHLKNVPNIYCGCELYYYNGLSKTDLLSNFTLGSSDYILIEPNFFEFGNNFRRELLHIKNVSGFVPIIAHIERYHKEKEFKKFIAFIKKHKIPTQVNASSFLNEEYNHTLKKLIKKNVITFIATDTHSLKNRPPLFADAVKIIKEKYGEIYLQRLLKNSEQLLKKITTDED